MARKLLNLVELYRILYMKRLILLALATVSLVHGVSAQDYEYEDVNPRNSRGIDNRNLRFGIFLAPNLSWMKPTASKSDDGLYIVDNAGSRIGFAWGLLMDYYFAENYGIATGFRLNTTGGRINTVFNTNNASQTPQQQSNTVTQADFAYKLQYLEIPFNLKLRSDGLSQGVRVFGQIGLSAGINISKKASYDVTYYDNATTLRVASGDNEKLRGGLSVTPVILQLNLGGGMEYPITEKLSLYTGLFFNNGFAPDATNPKELKMDYTGRFSDGNIRLNNVSLQLGLLF